MNNDTIDYYQSSSDSETDSRSILLEDDTEEEDSYQNNNFDDELIFAMDNLTDSTTDSIKSPTNENGIHHESPPSLVPSHSKENNNDAVMMRSSSYQNKFSDPFMMFSRSLGAFEMGESFLSSYEELLGSSLPTDLSSINTLHNLDLYKTKEVSVADNKSEKRVSFIEENLQDEENVKAPSSTSLKEAPLLDTCLNEDTLTIEDKEPSPDTQLEEIDLNEQTLINHPDSPINTEITLVGEIPIIRNTGMLVKELPINENDPLIMTDYNVSKDDSVPDDGITSTIPPSLPTFADPYQEWFNRSQNCFFRDKKRSKKTSKKRKQVSYQVYKKAKVLKVVGLNSNTIFRDLQKHFYDPSILNIRYLRLLNTAFITFRNHLSMMNAVLKLDGTFLDGMMISCIPSTAKEMSYETEISVNYKAENYANHTIRGYLNFRNEAVVPYIIQCTPIQVPRCYERYFIVKPKLMREVSFSLRHNYWYVIKRNSDYLNRLFENTESVYFIYSVTGSKSLQGYARMKSNVINIKSATMSDLDGTPFSTNKDIKFGSTGRVWQYVFRVEWMMQSYVSLGSLSHLRNAWCNNSLVKTSTDFTQLDPEFGRYILDKFHI